MGSKENDCSKDSYCWSDGKCSEIKKDDVKECTKGNDEDGKVKEGEGACHCDPTSTKNECGEGKYCHDDGTCAEEKKLATDCTKGDGEDGKASEGCKCSAESDKNECSKD